jgi:hypothetical protein
MDSLATKVDLDEFKKYTPKYIVQNTELLEWVKFKPE